MPFRTTVLQATLVLALTSCKSKPTDSTTSAEGTVTVARVESGTPERPGAEHCEHKGQACMPLAPSQKIAARGWVRTLAGGKVSLDFGHGRRVDLDSLSQLELDRHIARLERGQFSVDSTPLISKDPSPPLLFSVSGRDFQADPQRPTTTSLRVDGGETLLTVRRGQLHAPGLPEPPQSGQSLRLTQARAFRIANDGGELPDLLPVAPRTAELGTWLSPGTDGAARGLGTMSARLPNTEEKRDGVRLLKHHVKVRIIDGYAYTQIEEEFENTTPHVLEGQYRFAVPADASLSRLGLWVDDRLMEGEMLERKRARAIYTSIVDRPIPRDPALLEWENGGTMSLKVFPILPHKTRRVLLAYHQTLSAEGGLLRYVLPLSLGPDRRTPIEEFSIEVTAQDRHAGLGSPLVRAYDTKVESRGEQQLVSYAARAFIPHADFEVTIPRTEHDAAQLSAHVTEWGAVDALLSQLVPSSPSSRPQVPAIARTSPPVATAGYFGLRLRVDLPSDNPRPGFSAVERAIVIDTSHSQSKETIAAQAELAFGMLLEMDPDEPFVLLSCDSACESWVSTRARAPAANESTGDLPARLVGARDFLRNLKPGGASDIAGALAAAAVHLERLGSTNRTRQVIYMGDGRASAGELSALAIKQRVSSLLARAQVELRLVAVGHAIDHDLLRGIAIELGATLDSLQSGVSLEQRVWEISSALRRPILLQPRLELPRGLIAVESQALPALRLGQELLVVGELLDLQGGAVVLTGTLAGRPYRLEKSVRFSASERTQNPMIPSLWARNRISLLQSLEPTDDVRAQIVDLSTRYRTMSRYTSFLVLENDAMYQDFGITRPEREKMVDEVTSFIDQRAPEFDQPTAQAKDELPFEPQQRHAAPAAERAAKKPSAAPASPPASSPAPKRSRSEGGPLDLEVGRMAASGSSVAAPKGRSDDAPFAPEPLGEASKSPPPRGGLHLRRVQKFHVQTRVADDAWRTWSDEHLAAVEQSWRADPESRARNEAWIRALLQNGRFAQALSAAEHFFSLDPDSPVAARLLAWSSVVHEDRERARLMLDVQAEQAPEQLELHLQAARAFAAAGDEVRACAHRRSSADLRRASALPKDSAPQDLIAAATREADQCWREVTQATPAEHPFPVSTGDAGALEVWVECDAGTSPLDCPAPVIVTPLGEVYSPWTPGPGKTDRARVTLLRLSSGSYFVLVVGGAPGVSGKVRVSGKGSDSAIPFSGGALHTVAQVQIAYY